MARGQVNIGEEAELRIPVHSTFEVLVVQCVVGCCREELGPFCWAVLAALFSASHPFDKHTSQVQY